MMDSPSIEPSPGRASDSQSFLRAHHTRNAARPIEVPNEFGAFPDSRIVTVPPFVVDANELFRDVAYAARTGKRTTLVSLANSGYIRLFCARHVLDEIPEHVERMATRLKASLPAFMDRWTMEYIPLLRRVEISESLITEEEARRIETLKDIDPDDIPSATLAIALGAYYYTRDRPAREAVYGPGVDHELHDGVLKIVRAHGDEVALREIVNLFAAVPTGISFGAYKGLEWAWRRSPWIAVLGLAASVVAWRSVPPEWRQRLKAGTVGFLEIAGPYFVEYGAVNGVLDSVMAYTPQWGDVREATQPTTLLARACLHTLSRTGRSQLSAAELTKLLPVLDAPQSEAKVRTTLRSLSCFEEIYKGRWQVGAAVAQAHR